MRTKRQIPWAHQLQHLDGSPAIQLFHMSQQHAPLLQHHHVDELGARQR